MVLSFSHRIPSFANQELGRDFLLIELRKNLSFFYFWFDIRSETNIFDGCINFRKTDFTQNHFFQIVLFFEYFSKNFGGFFFWFLDFFWQQQSLFE